MVTNSETSSHCSQ